MENKRGQLTIFIIVAILIIAGIALFLTLKDKKVSDETNYPPQVTPIVNYVQQCLEETADLTIYGIGQQGGYNEPIYQTKSGITYYLLEGQNHFLSKDQLERELSSYFSRKAFLCLRHFENFTDYQIEEGNFETTSKIFKDKVSFYINYPLTIRKGDFTYRINDFSTESFLDLNNVYDFVSSFISKQEQVGGVCLSCLDQLPEDLFVNVTSDLDNDVVFVVTDKSLEINNKPFEWVFANKY